MLRNYPINLNTVIYGRCNKSRIRDLAIKLYLMVTVPLVFGIGLTVFIIIMSLIYIMPAVVAGFVYVFLTS